MAERGGFEPPWELVTPKSISSRSRYDHFGTSPLIFLSLPNSSYITSYSNDRFRPTFAGRLAHAWASHSVTILVTFHLFYQAFYDSSPDIFSSITCF
jgi:hypothetical protein